MSFPRWPYKDPNEVLDYAIDWALRLEGDSIVTSTWLAPVPDDITKESDHTTVNTTTIWLSGGTIGKTYLFTNRVTTAGNRTMDQSVTLEIKER